MKRIKTVLFGLMLLGLAPAVAWAQAPGTGIASTPHDFTSGTYGSSTVGTCTFCHTPHKALSTALLWNHNLSTNPNFSWDITATTAGTVFPTIANDYNGPTAKCLSCHDGTVAPGDVNWFNAAGPTVVNATAITDTAFQVGASGAMAGNHPVAMPYPYGNAANAYNGQTTGSGAELLEWQATPETLNIRLFTDASGTITAGPTAGTTGIECSSCHDPHNKASTGDYFLRGTLAGNDTAYICLKCHVK